jgi:hypothetical protein
MHRWASEREDKNAWAAKARQAEDAEAWVQAKRGYKDALYVATQKKPNHAAHQGGGARSPQVLMALFGSAALFGQTAIGKNKGKTIQGISADNFFTGHLEAHQQTPSWEWDTQLPSVGGVV